MSRSTVRFGLLAGLLGSSALITVSLNGLTPGRRRDVEGLEAPPPELPRAGR